MWFWLKEREAMFTSKVLTSSIKLPGITVKVSSLGKIFALSRGRSQES